MYWVYTSFKACSAALPNLLINGCFCFSLKIFVHIWTLKTEQNSLGTPAYLWKLVVSHPLDLWHIQCTMLISHMVLANCWLNWMFTPDHIKKKSSLQFCFIHINKMVPFMMTDSSTDTDSEYEVLLLFAITDFKISTLNKGIKDIGIEKSAIFVWVSFSLSQPVHPCND